MFRPRYHSENSQQAPFMKCLLCTTDTPYIFYSSYKNLIRWAVPFPFEDTEALQPKPKATKLSLESRLFTPGACVSKQRMSRDLACSPSSQEAVCLPDSQLERYLIKGCPRQGSEPQEEWSWEDPADPGQQAQCTLPMCETEHIL